MSDQSFKDKLLDKDNHPHEQVKNEHNHKACQDEIDEKYDGRDRTQTMSQQLIDQPATFPRAKDHLIASMIYNPDRIKEKSKFFSKYI